MGAPKFYDTGISRPAPATKTRDDVTTVSTAHAHAGAGSTISRRVNAVSIVSEERHGSVMEKSSDGVLFVQPSLTITEVLGILQNPPETCITQDVFDYFNEQRYPEGLTKDKKRKLCCNFRLSS